MVIHDDSAEVPERITPAERPPYWSDCENMTLPELGRFISYLPPELDDLDSTLAADLDGLPAAVVRQGLV